MKMIEVKTSKNGGNKSIKYKKEKKKMGEDCCGSSCFDWTYEWWCLCGNKSGVSALVDREVNEAKGESYLTTDMSTFNSNGDTGMAADDDRHFWRRTRCRGKRNQ